MDEAQIRELIRDTAQTTATAVIARVQAARDEARADLHRSEGWITWKQLTPAMRRRAGLIGGVVFLAGVLIGWAVERFWI